MNKKSNVVKNVLLWSLTVFFALSALVYLPALTGFISLLIAVILVPIHKWQELIGRFVNGKIKTIVIAILFILAIIFVPSTDTSYNNIPPETVISSEEEIVVTEASTEPSSETTTEHATEPTTEPTAEPVTDPTTEPTTEPTVESTAEPTAESVAEPTQAPTVQPTEDEGQDYVLNTNTMKFHYPSCSSADDIKDKNKVYFHGTREELIARGFDPCGRCHP